MQITFHRENQLFHYPVLSGSLFHISNLCAGLLLYYINGSNVQFIYLLIAFFSHVDTITLWNLAVQWKMKCLLEGHLDSKNQNRCEEEVILNINLPDFQIYSSSAFLPKLGARENVPVQRRILQSGEQRATIRESRPFVARICNSLFLTCTSEAGQVRRTARPRRSLGRAHVGSILALGPSAKEVTNSTPVNKVSRPVNYSGGNVRSLCFLNGTLHDAECLLSLKAGAIKNSWKIIFGQECSSMCPFKLYHKLDYSFQHAPLSPMLK